MVGVQSKAGQMVATLREAVDAYESKRGKDQLFDITVVYNGSSSPRKSKGTGAAQISQPRPPAEAPCMKPCILACVPA